MNDVNAPSCSEYTKQAIAIHGFFKGCLMGAYRILRCNPLNPGRYDPVPPKKIKKKDYLLHGKKCKMKIQLLKMI